MDSLLATYKDEEEDEDEEATPTTTTTTGSTAADADGGGVVGAVGTDTEPMPIDVPPVVTGTPSDTPTEPQNDGRSEPDPSDDLSSEEAASDGSKKSPKREHDEDGEEQPSSKKQKPVSSLSEANQDSPALPEGDNVPASTTVATNGGTGTGTGTNPKKSKKKNNNVWATKSKKGKKKNKGNNNNNNNHANNGDDNVLITPVQRFPDKGDDTPEMKICLSRAFKAEKVELSEDRLTAGSTKGYRMVRATRGVMEGAWYFEIKVVKLGETGHTRLGWSTAKGDLQAPVGYDGNSFGYRDIDGSKIHKALREKYGEEGYKEGDVIGCYINLPEGDKYEPTAQNLAWYKGQKYAYPKDGKEEPPKVVPGSEISFFKNGVCQGVAFEGLYGGRYYPAASMYTLPNEPNCTVKFNFGPDFEFFPEDFNERPIPRPMIEVPYHSFDNRVENGESNEKKP